MSCLVNSDMKDKVNVFLKKFCFVRVNIGEIKEFKLFICIEILPHHFRLYNSFNISDFSIHLVMDCTSLLNEIAFFPLSHTHKYVLNGIYMA